MGRACTTRAKAVRHGKSLNRAWISELKSSSVTIRMVGDVAFLEPFPSMRLRGIRHPYRHRIAICRRANFNGRMYPGIDP